MKVAFERFLSYEAIFSEAFFSDTKMFARNFEEKVNKKYVLIILSDEGLALFLERQYFRSIYKEYS